MPNTRIIHVRRDPLDTCFSCFAMLFLADQRYCYDVAGLRRYYRGYAALMQHWRAVLPPGVMLDVQYEDLVADLEGGKPAPGVILRPAVGSSLPELAWDPPTGPHRECQPGAAAAWLQSLPAALSGSE